MSSTINMNIVLSQGNSVKEVQSVKEQNLELNQILVAQHQKKKEAEGKDRVKEFEDTAKVRNNKDESRGSKHEARSEQEKKKGDETPDDNKPQEHILDIVV
ncbi:MAG: hypothetical protein ABIF87_12345 [Pseudomonadota bacterium]